MDKGLLSLYTLTIINIDLDNTVGAHTYSQIYYVTIYRTRLLWLI